MKKTGNQTRKIPAVEGLEHGFIRSQQKALEIATQYIRKKETVNQTLRRQTEGLYKFPEQGAPFEISETALKNTLKYIYETLKHPCYMLCISVQKRHFYKLEQTETAPYFEQFTKQEFQRVKNDLSQKDIQHIEKVLQKPFRIMQCIVKPQSRDTFSQEYLEWIGEMASSLPFGVFIFNLTDAVLLRKDGKMPFPKTNDPPSPILTPVLPIFSTSGQNGYWDIPIPTYDDIKQGSIVWNTDWNTKKEVAVFRGGPTGCGTREDTNARLAVAKLKSPLLDAGVVSGESRSIRYDPKHGLSMLSMDGISTVGRLTMEQQSNYKYIVHIDGNVLAYRLLTTMLSGSVILRIKSPFVSWIDHYLLPNQHYIEVLEPKDLLTKIQWCKENDDICQRIAFRSRELAEKVLSRRFLRGYFTELLWNTVTPQSTDCLPWDRSSNKIYAQPKPFRPNPEIIPVLKKAKKITRKKLPKIQNPTLQTETTGVDSYMKSTEKEKCRKGYVTDRKNKMRCVSVKNKPKIDANVEENQEVVVPKNQETQPVVSSVVSPVPVVSPLQNYTEPTGVDSYMKSTEKEKCRKGYVTDRKNKMRCVYSVKKKPKPLFQGNQQGVVEENQQGVVEENRQGVVEENQQGVVEENQQGVVEENQQGVVEPYMKSNEKEKCRKGYVTDRKNKMRCIPK